MLVFINPSKFIIDDIGLEHWLARSFSVSAPYGVMLIMREFMRF